MRACRLLRAMGYANTVNIGGIKTYRGFLERLGGDGYARREMPCNGKCRVKVFPEIDESRIRYSKGWS